MIKKVFNVADIILINPHGTRFVGDYTLPLGLLQSSVYISEKYNVKILDLRVKPDWKSALLAELKKEPHFVGISTITGPNLTSALQISKFVKENSKALVVWGGIHASLLPGETLEHPLVDIVVKGEGEETFIELADAIINKKPLKGILGVWYKEDGKVKSNPDRPPVDLNKLPPVPYDLLDDIEKYIWVREDGVRVINYMSSRGCPQLCTFCYVASFYNSKWKQINAQKVLDDFQYLIERFKVGHIYMNDDNFFVNLLRVKDIAQGILDRKFDISWDVLGAHAQTTVRMTDDVIKLLDKSRCTGLLTGVESGSPRILELVKKNITVQMVLDANKKFIGTGIIPTYSFISGYPTETNEELKMTVDVLFRLWKDNKNIIPGNIKPFIPYPGTPLYDMAVKYGFEPPTSVEGWADVTWDNYLKLKTPWLTPKEKKLRVDLYYSTILMNPDYMFVKNKFFKAVTTMMSPMMKFRVKNLNFTLPFELRAVRTIHHTLL